jgi:hypothetical protein
MDDERIMWFISDMLEARPATLNLGDFTGADKGAAGFVKMYLGILEAATPSYRQDLKWLVELRMVAISS